jgi:hypothetical protein
VLHVFSWLKCLARNSVCLVSGFLSMQCVLYHRLRPCLQFAHCLRAFLSVSAFARSTAAHRHRLAHGRAPDGVSAWKTFSMRM